MLDANVLLTARKVRNEATLQCSLRQVQRELAAKGFRYQNVEKSLPLTQSHMTKWVEFAEMCSRKKHPWHLTIFHDKNASTKMVRTMNLATLNV